MGLVQKLGKRALGRRIAATHQLAADFGVVADVKARVAHGRVQNGQQPQAGHTQVLQVGQAVGQALEVLVEQVHVQRIHHHFLEPGGGRWRGCGLGCSLQFGQESVQLVGVLVLVQLLPELAHLGG